MSPTMVASRQTESLLFRVVFYELEQAIGKLKDKVPTGNHVRAGKARAESAPRAIAPVVAAKAVPQPAAKRALKPVALPDPLELGQAMHLAVCFWLLLKHRLP